MNVNTDALRQLNVVSWDNWWFPGLGELLNMLSFAFWWELAFVIAAVPVFIAILIIYAMATDN